MKSLKLLLLPTVYGEAVDLLYHDESYSTHTAEGYMYESGIRDKQKRLHHIDKLSASVILEDFLNIMNDDDGRFLSKSRSRSQQSSDT